MGFYVDRIAPRLTHLCCGSRRIAEQRGLIVPQAEGVVVEIGFGSGHNLGFYRKGKVTQVVGVEPNVGMLRLADRNLAAAPVPVEFHQGVAEDLPLETHSADTAVLTYTLCSVAEPARALSELRRVLKPSGRLLLLEHGRSDEAGVARWQDRLDPVWTVCAAGCHINRPTRQAVEAAGFSIEQLDTFYLRGAPHVVGFHSRGIAVPR
ncbi:class I SAM-dependent methyltransferase [Microbaculum sp. FT89]|uniref:class I SAM-dependent methyltransferase n=1 Tax=Microbaculum sp. FT89 TaxID=3447298 RepID=UPI003F530572